MFSRNAFIAFFSFSSRRQIFPLRSNRPSGAFPWLPASSSAALHSASTSSTSFTMDYNNNMNMLFPSQKEAQQHVFQKAISQANTNSNINGNTHYELKRCGDLACQHDSFLQKLSSSRIISYASFEQQKEKTKVGGKKNKKQKEVLVSTASSYSENSNESFHPIIYAITLSDSIFFPEGGGQFADHGTLTLTLKDKKHEEEDRKEHQMIELHVYDSQNINEICILFCHLPCNSESNHNDVLNMLNRSPDEVQVDQSLDWTRRFDQMTQHSAQHLCSAVALSDFDIGTHTFSLGQKISYIDFVIEESWEKEYAVDIFTQIEEKVNCYIRDNLPMTPKWLDRNDPLFQSKVRSRLLPEGLEGTIRLVEIGNDASVDLNTCCGTHITTLGQLQLIKFFRMERVKPTIFRVYFASAKRLNALINNMYDIQAKLTSMMACTESEQVQRVTQLLNDKRDREREIRTLQEKLSTCQAKEILEHCRSNDVNLAVTDLGNVDMGYMTLVSTKVMNGIENEKAIFLFVGGEDDCDEGSFLLVGDKAIVDKFGKNVAEMFDGRGGGRNGKFQGKGSKVRSSLEDVKSFLTSIIPKL